MWFEKLLYVTALSVFLTSCSTPIEKNQIETDTDSLASKKPVADLSHIDVEIAINDTVLKYGEKIVLDIRLINHGQETQKLLFDKPALSTGGPRGISVSVTDKRTNKSVLKYQNKELLLSSKLYDEDALKDNYYTLKTKESIHRKYELTDIVIYDNKDNLLPKGIYNVQAFYQDLRKPELILSNILTLSIK